MPEHLRHVGLRVKARPLVVLFQSQTECLFRVMHLTQDATILPDVTERSLLYRQLHMEVKAKLGDSQPTHRLAAI